MKIIGKGKPVRNDQQVIIDQTIIVEITETEARKITGVDGKPQISGRFKPGREVNISPVYDKVAKINEKQTELIAAARAVKTSADDILANIVLTEEV